MILRYAIVYIQLIMFDVFICSYIDLSFLQSTEINVSNLNYYYSYRGSLKAKHN